MNKSLEKGYGPRIAQLSLELQNIEVELEKYRQILHSSPDPIAITDLNHRIAYVNPAWEKSTGYMFKEVFEKNPLFLIADQKSLKIYQKMVRALEKGKSFTTDKFIFKKKSGKTYHLQVTSFPIQKNGRNLFFVRISRDISAQVELLEKIQSLAYQNELILSSAGDGIYGIDLKGRGTFINPAGAQLLGYSQEELIGKNLHNAFHRKNIEGKKIPASKCPHYTKTLQKGKQFHSRDYVFWKKDGSPLFVDITSTPIFEKGKIAGAVVVFTDISEQKRLEALKTDFLSMVSHELKTPITTVQLISDALLRHTKQNDKTSKMLTTINYELKRLTSLINDLLDVSRLETDKFKLNSTAISLKNYLSRIVENMQILSEKHKIVAKNIPDVTIIGDRDKLDQVFINLISNAVKYSPENTTVTISATPAKNKVVIAVSDQGIGIKEKDIPHIFDKYFQIKSGKRGSGFGLGLYITKEIIKKHKGTIRVQSTEGKGSTFYITLPVIT